MRKSVQIEHQVSGSEPILIVDKIGAIGEALAKELSKDFLVVLVSKNNQSEKNQKIIHIAFKKKIPQVPDNKYLKIFLVDDGESVTRKSTFSFISFARKNSTPIYFIGSIRNVDIEHSDQITTSYVNSKVLIFGDLFDKTLYFDKSEAINKYILQARTSQKIMVPGNGLALSFPITFEDTIKLIIKASYLDIPQKIILLFYEHAITDISLANLFKKINPNIKVDFAKEKIDEQKIYIPKGSQHAISKYDLTGKIRELEIEEKENRELKIVGKTSKKGRPVFKLILFVLFAFLFVLLLPLGMTYSYSALGSHSLKNAGKAIEKGDIKKAIKESKQAKTFFETAEKTSSPMVLESKIINKSKDWDSIAGKIESGKNLSVSMIYLLEGANGISKIYSGESVDPKGDFSNASSSIKNGLVLIQKVKAEGNLPKEFEEKINDLNPIIDLFVNSSEVLPEILGFEKGKKYLIVFQDNQELRPGGGFISAYGVLKIKDAKFSEIKMKDVYSLDNTLKAHVEPPFAVRRYLPSVHLFLRDSNYNPDFVKSAIDVANIYTLESSEEIDGVIGVDLDFAKNILNVIGPVKLSENNRMVDEKNIYNLAYLNSKNKDLQKSKKTYFFVDLGNAILDKLEKEKNVSYLLLAQNIGKSITEKHLNFAYQNPSQQNVFTANNWSSSLWDNRQNSDEKINDFLGISEANLGNNSVNHKISRSISKKTIILDNGKVSSRTTIAFKNNTSKNEKNSIYKNYLRVIVPEGSKITSVSVNGKEEKIVDAVTDPSVYERLGYNPPVGIEIEGEKEMGKTMFGIFVEVLPEEVKTISILCDLPFAVSRNQKSINYSLRIYKQPGIDSYPFDLALSLPQGYEVLNAENPYSTLIAEDKELTYLIAQK